MIREKLPKLYWTQILRQQIVGGLLCPRCNAAKAKLRNTKFIERRFCTSGAIETYFLLTNRNN